MSKFDFWRGKSLVVVLIFVSWSLAGPSSHSFSRGPFFTIISEASSQEYSSPVFKFSLDQTNLIKGAFFYSESREHGNDGSDGGNYHFRFYKDRFRYQRSDHHHIPEGLQKGIQVRIDGKSIPFRQEGPYWISEGQWPAPAKDNSTTHEIECYFQGIMLGHYQFRPGTRDVVIKESSKQLPSLLMRLMHKTDDSDHRLNLLSPGRAAKTNVDLHTHFTGALRTRELIQVALDYAIPYPTEYLRELGIDYDRNLTFEGADDKVEYVPLTSKSIKRLGSFTEALDRLAQSFEIALDETTNFHQLEKIYKYREGIIKYPENPKNGAFAKMLLDLARDYHKMGITYAELSFSKMKGKDWLQVAEEVLPAIEKEYGVKLRFLVSLRRFAASNGKDGENWKSLKQLMDVKDSPYIVGVDVVGEETNSLDDCEEIIRAVKAYRDREAPHFQIRIHAGETSFHPENVKKAIQWGATRIGHGVYGVDQEVLKLAAQNGVIVEMNVDSNYALENITDVDTFLGSFKAYQDSGVRITIGTDGHGIYNNSLHSAEAVMARLGADGKLWENIGRSDREYVNRMEEVFRRKLLQQEEKKGLSKKIQAKANKNTHHNDKQKATLPPVALLKNISLLPPAPSNCREE